MWNSHHSFLVKNGERFNYEWHFKLGMDRMTGVLFDVRYPAGYRISGRISRRAGYPDGTDIQTGWVSRRAGYLDGPDIGTGQISGRAGYPDGPGREFRQARYPYGTDIKTGRVSRHMHKCKYKYNCDLLSLFSQLFHLLVSTFQHEKRIKTY